MSDTTPHVEVAIGETVRLREYTDVETVWPTFADLSQDVQRRKVARLTPDHEEESQNIVVDNHVSQIVDIFDPNASPTSIDADQIAIGDSTKAPLKTDTSLNNELARFAVGSSTNNTRSLKLEIVLDTTQYNGNTLAEVGAIHNSSGTLLNHALVGPRTKTSDKTVTIEVIWNYEAQ